MSTATAPPILDFSPFYGADSEAKAKLVEEVRECCHYNGFFQITGHKVPLELQRPCNGMLKAILHSTIGGEDAN